MKNLPETKQVSDAEFALPLSKVAISRAHPYHPEVVLHMLATILRIYTWPIVVSTGSPGL